MPRERAVAGHAARAVVAFQVAEPPVAVDHLHFAANVREGIGKTIVAQPAAAGLKLQMLMLGPPGISRASSYLKPMVPFRSMDRASDCACGGRASSSFSSMGNSSLVTCSQPVGPLGRIADLAHDVHQLVLAEGRKVHLQAVVLQFQQAVAVFQAVGELAVGKGDVPALDPHLRLPGAAVVAELDVGVDQAFRPELLPLLLELAGQDRQELLVQRQLADVGLDGHGAGRLQAAAARQRQAWPGCCGP